MRFRDAFAFNLLVFIVALLSSVTGRVTDKYCAEFLFPYGNDTEWRTATQVQIKIASSGLPRPKHGEKYGIYLRPDNGFLEAILIETLDFWNISPDRQFYYSTSPNLDNSDRQPAGDFTLNLFLIKANGKYQDKPMAKPVPITIPE